MGATDMAGVVSPLGELVLADRLLPRFRNVPDHLQWAWLIAATHRGRIKGLLLGYPATYPQLPTSDQVPKQEGPPVQPCTCRYAVQHIRDVIGTVPLDVYGIGKRYGVWCFTIDPWCPHHGVPGASEGREQAYREMEVEEAAYWTTLDQEERTGHR